MATQPNRTFVTPQDYLERERVASAKSEYYKGEMFAMAGATREHILIVGNLVYQIKGQLRKSGCEVYSNDMRVLINATGLFTYPDIVVACGEPVFFDQQLDTLINPRVIMEVLSKSTENYDRGGKFHQYKRIASLREYLTISQTEMLVDHSVRQPDGGWLSHEIGLENPHFSLASCPVKLNLPDIYDEVPLKGS